MYDLEVENVQCQTNILETSGSNRNRKNSKKKIQTSWRTYFKGFMFNLHVVNLNETHKLLGKIVLYLNVSKKLKKTEDHVGFELATHGVKSKKFLKKFLQKILRIISSVENSTHVLTGEILLNFAKNVEHGVDVYKLAFHTLL